MTKGVMPVKPVDGEITKGGEYEAERDNSICLHTGVDYGVWHKDVHASLDGVVERALYTKPRQDEITYGQHIVLYHGKNVNTGKHTYTLYAHLDKMSVNVGDTVKRGQDIAISGNSGNVGYHLHYEVKESPTEVDMATPGAVSYGTYRVNPVEFLNKPFLKESDDLSDEEIKEKILQRMKADTHIDFKRGTWRIDVMLGGKKAGSIDRHSKEIKLTLSREKVEEILTRPPVSPKEKVLYIR